MGKWVGERRVEGRQNQKGKRKGEKKVQTGVQRDLQRGRGAPEGVFLLLNSVDERSMEDRATGPCQRRTAV